MKLPREVSGEDLAQRLEKVGYRPTRQTGSHIRLTATIPGEHHVTIPRHSSLKIGTLSGILRDVAEHLQISKDELLRRLWGKE
jgi:predicted RNA binding protein YcfA (HicA-like mRNA interferase family)